MGMADFFGFQTGVWPIKALYASLAVAVVGLVFTIYHGGGDADKGSRSVFLKCYDKECGNVKEYSSEEFTELTKNETLKYAEQLAQTDQQTAEIMRTMVTDRAKAMTMPGAMMVRIPNWGDIKTPLTCSKCSKQTMLLAKKCPKCSTVFVQYDQNLAYTDKCPNCGYSRAKEREDQKGKKGKKEQI